MPEIHTKGNSKSPSRHLRGKHEGGVFQRADGLWAATLALGNQSDGRRRRKTIYAKTKQEALRKLDEFRNQMKSGHLPNSGRLTFGQFLQTWLDSIKPSVAARTYTSCSDHVRLYIAPCIGGIRLSELTALHIQQYYCDLAAGRFPTPQAKTPASESKQPRTRKPGPVSACMVRKAGVTLGIACQQAVDLRLIPHNPVRDVRKPRHRPAEMKVIDPELVGKFFEEAKKDRLYALWVFLLERGARPSEACALLWSDIDWSGSAVQIVRALDLVDGKVTTKDPKTLKSKRRIDLSRFALEALEEHRKSMETEGLYAPDSIVFCNSSGGWLHKANVLQRHFLPILKRADLPRVRVYDLRHSCATWLLMAGESVKVVAERLGHNNATQVLTTYGHVTDRMGKQAAAKMDAIFRAGQTKNQMAA